MDAYRISQILLLTAAFILGVSAPAFNGLSMLALLLVGSVLVIEKRRLARAATPMKAETEEQAAA